MLLWGVILLRLGVTRGFGANLRAALSRVSSNRVKGFVAGSLITALLQSSTATILIVTSFVGRHILGASAAMAVVLGADVGTTLVAQALSFDLSAVAPIAMIAGFMFFVGGKSGRMKHIGRILVGLALMLFALDMIAAAAVPLKSSETLAVVLQSLEQDPLFAVVIAIILTWLMHSSLAFVLLLLPLVSSDVLSITIALYMVLGANLGGTIAPLVATMRDLPEARRIPLGNTLIKIFGVSIAFFALPYLHPYLMQLDDNFTRQVVNFHTIFNLVLALCFLPFTGLIEKLCRVFIPDKPLEDHPGQPRYLDENSIDVPSMALAAAMRETLRMAELVQKMLEDTISVFRNNDEKLLRTIREQDDVIDDLYSATKTYMARLNQEFMDPEEADRYVQILTFATNLEHSGDVIDKNLLPLAKKKIDNQHNFSDEGMKEIETMHALVLESVQLAQSIFLSGDLEMARQLLRDKEAIRKAEIEGMASHIDRLGEGVPETIATTSLHLDIIRDYRRINTYMCTVAYPLLEQSGQLRSSRLITN